MSLVYYDAWMKRRRATPLVGPGAAAVDEFEPAPGSRRSRPAAGWRS